MVEFTIQQKTSHPHTTIISVPHMVSFAVELAASLHLPVVHSKVLHFPDGECEVQVKDPILTKRVIVVQSQPVTPNDYLIETLLLVDTLKRLGVSEVILVCTYLAYTRQSKAESVGVSVASRLFARCLEEAGVARLIFMDAHSEHSPAFYRFPVEQVTARQLFVKEIQKRKLDALPLIVVGPDKGARGLAASYAEELGTSFASIEKKRLDAKRVHHLTFLGDVKGKNVLLADDVCSTAGTLVSAAKACREKGANHIFACVTHGLFADDALSHIEESLIELLLTSDTITPTDAVKQCKKICVVPTVSAFSAALTKLFGASE